MVETKPEQGAIQLDNQGIQVRIMTPSGRFQVTDKVTGVVWNMKPGRSSGTIVSLRDGKEIVYTLGGSGKRGVLFTRNYYMTRSTSTDDYHDVSLTGALGDDPSVQITIRYLISSTFPVVNCYCYASGEHMEQIYKIQFPLGLRLADGDRNAIWLPREIDKLQLDDVRGNETVWQPSSDREHRVAGAPFFILTQAGIHDKTCGCIGYLQHPLSLLEIQKGEKERFVHPSSSRLDITGKSEKKPYHFRCQFVPSDDLEALCWLYKEYLLDRESDFLLESLM